jgi:hypothetical protein
MNDNYNILDFQLRELVKNPDRSLASELPKFGKKFREHNIKLHDNNYYMLSNILSMDGVGFDRILDTVLYFVKSKDFKYDANNRPETFVWSVATATYWMDALIFDPNIYQIDSPKSYADVLLVKFRDIGTTLIEKGFNFNMSRKEMGNAVYVPYAERYLKQCRKRIIYLHKLAQTQGKE